MHDETIARNLKALRKEKGISLKEIAESVDVTVSFLSQVENGKTIPSVSTLKAIAKYLNTTISALVGEENLIPNPIVREKERKRISYSDGTIMHLLTSPDANKQMEPLLFSLEPNATSGNKMYKHFGQEFVLVLKGTLEITLNDQQYILNKGDSIYFNSSIMHSFKNINKGVTEAIWVDTPPTF